MGTRADFYVGKGKDAEWLGSIAWDGMEIDDVENATTEDEYRELVTAFLKGRDDATFPEMGWPWPWETSGLTDCSYWWFDGEIWEEYASRYVPRNAMRDEEGEPNPASLGDVIDYPDMSDRKNMTLGKRSGVIVI